MKRIPLRDRSKKIIAWAIVDDEDYVWASKFTWCRHMGGYAYRAEYLGGGKRKPILRRYFLHRLILKTPEGLFTDHINRNKLDNRRKNLRICDKTLNKRNSGLRRDNKTGFSGVNLSRGRFIVRIGVGPKRILIGSFKTLKEAKVARLNAEKAYWKDQR